MPTPLEERDQLLNEIYGAEAPAPSGMTVDPSAPAQSLSPDPFSLMYNQAQRSVLAEAPDAEQTAALDEIYGPDHSGAEQFFGGAVDRIAATIGATPDVVAAMLQEGGTRLKLSPEEQQYADIEGPSLGMSPDELQGSLERSGNLAQAALKPDDRAVTQALRDAAEAVGLPANVGDSLIAQWGGDTATGLMILGTAIATRGKTGPMGTARAGAGKLERFGRFFPRQAAKMGEFAVQRPGAAVAMEVGAAGLAPQGGNLGEAVGGGPGRVAGEIVGGVVGAHGGQSVAKLGNRVVQGVDNTLMRATGRKLPEAPTLVQGGVDPNQTTFAADAYIQRERAAIDTQIQGVLDRNQPVLRARSAHGAIVDSIEMQERLALDLDKADELANKVVGRAWRDAIPKTHRMSPEYMEDLKQRVETARSAMGRTFGPNSEDIPQREIDEILSWRASERSTVLLNLRTRMMEDIRLSRAAGGTRLSARYRKNLQKLVGLIEKYVGEDLPDATLTRTGVLPSAKLRAAQALSTRYHDLFTRSPVGEALAESRAGGKRLNPAEILDYLGRNSGSGQTIKDIDDFLLQTGRKNLPAVQQRFEDALRTTWRDAAQGLDPSAQMAAAEGFMRRVRPGIQKSLPVYGELKAATEQLGMLLAQKAEMDRGVAAKFLGSSNITGSREPQNAIRALFSAPHPADYARDLMRAMGNDPEAVAGLRNLAIGEYFRRFSGSAKTLSNELKGPSGRALREVLTPEQFQQLDELVGLGLRLEGGDASLRQKGRSFVIRILAPFMGAGVGRFTSRLTGGGTVQQPGVLAAAFRNVAEEILGALPPGELLAAAVLDPKWRRVLYASVPHDDKSARAMLRTMRYGLGVMNAGQLEVQRRLESDQE